MSAFQHYQAEFTDHIRNPGSVSRPQGVVARRMKIYAEIVFNNMDATLSACFPVSRQILGPRRWKRLVRDFLAEHRCATPLFRQIPEELLHWFDTHPAAIAGLPPFLDSLAHYEWIELAVAVADVTAEDADAEGDLLQGRPVRAAALELLEYPYAVHHISLHFQPLQPDAEATRLLVFRGENDEVRFIEVNAVTARLVQLLQGKVHSGRDALEIIARELQHPAPASVLDYGATVLADFHRQGVILGVAL
jgi:hypothetical protein